MKPHFQDDPVAVFIRTPNAADSGLYAMAIVQTKGPHSTWFGKSVIMQALPCLIPKIVIIILPLLALGAEEQKITNTFHLRTLYSLIATIPIGRYCAKSNKVNILIFYLLRGFL
jgi:hypothetical protein